MSCAKIFKLICFNFLAISGVVAPVNGGQSELHFSTATTIACFHSIIEAFAFLMFVLALDPKKRQQLQ